MLGCSRHSTNIHPSELKEEIMSHENILARAFSVLEMWKISKYFNIEVRSFIFWRYFIIIGFRASNSSLTCPAINCELVKTFRLSISSSLVIFKSVKSASYLAWLLEALKLNRRTYSDIISLKLVRMSPAPLPCAFDTPSICNTHADVKSGYSVIGFILGFIVWYYTFEDEVDKNLCLHWWKWVILYIKFIKFYCLFCHSTRYIRSV